MTVSILHEFFPMETGPGHASIPEQRYYTEEASMAKLSKTTTRRRRTVLSIALFESALQPVNVCIHRTDPTLPAPPV